MFRLLLPLALLAIFQSAQAGPWKTQKFKKGDILACEMFIGFSHMLLATDSSTVAQLTSVEGNTTGISEESWESYHLRTGNDQTNCWVADTSNSPDLAVFKARQDIARFNNKDTYYHTLNCNCEHWATHWAHGHGYSTMTLQRAWGSPCEVNDNPITDAERAKFPTLGKTTNGVRCTTQCAKASGKDVYECSVQQGEAFKEFMLFPIKECSPRPGTTYKGNKCVGECQQYLDYWFCYTDGNKKNWEYCGPTDGLK